MPKGQHRADYDHTGYYQKKKDWICAYQYARRHGLDIYRVCADRGVEVPESFEKHKKSKTQSVEEIRERDKERTASQDDSAQQKYSELIRTVAYILGVSVKKVEEDRRKLNEERKKRNLPRLSWDCPDYFADIPITPYFSDGDWYALENL